MRATRLIGELLLGMYCAAAVMLVETEWQDAQSTSTASAFSSVSGTLLGFVLAALGLLATLRDRPLLEDMMRSRHYQHLVDDFIVSAILFGSSMLASVVALFAVDTSLRLLVAISFGFFVGAILRLVRAGHHFYLVLINA